MTKIIVALDGLTTLQTSTLLNDLDPKKCMLKVGYELYLQDALIVKDIISLWGFEIFLDLKLFDIPNTVSAAVREICDMDVWGTTIHTLGGEEMMMAAHESRLQHNPELKLIGVTIPTSMPMRGPLSRVGSHWDTDELVPVLANQAEKNSFDGIVCSALDIEDVYNYKLLTVCPGIRLKGDSDDDQQRVVTPTIAQEYGADYIVVGRSITRSKNPVKTLDAIYKSLNK